jgi:spore coat polysaccharide biosynthesis protein SpsF (cytidylyltransferase family)
MKNNTSKVTIMIQARIESKRFPQKVISSIAGKPMIWHIINRLKHVKSSNQIILLTTKKTSDKILVKLAEKNNILFFTGPINDVLKRYYLCANQFSADPIVRITGDCPLVDFSLIDQIIKFYQSHDYDYVSNTIKPTYPDGLDVEVFSFKTLEKMYKLATKKSDREHVTSFIIQNKSKFKIFNFKNKKDLSKFRLTVDEKNDLKLIRKIYSYMKPNTIFSSKAVYSFLKKNPDLLEINRNIIRNDGYTKSIKNES